MTAFPDTSFLCAIYRRQDNSPAAAAHFKAMKEPLHVSTLLPYKFRQSVRFQVWLHAQDKAKGYPQADADRALADLQSDLDTGAVALATVEWPDVRSRAETLSRQHTAAGGHRSLDVLHIATALHLEAEEFLRFDANQRKLARAAGLKVKP
jgi:predicted nucleic acid-binding protein